MARYPIAPSRALLAVLFFLSSGWAAKTVVILNPWRADPALSASTPQIFGAPNGWNGDAVAANQFTRMSGDLWSFTFASNNPGDFRLLNRGNNGWTEYGAQGSGSTSFNLNTLFATTDTVWILPGATMATPPTLRTSAPPSATLMILNPWEAASPGRAPSVQIESQGWAAATPVAGQPGWYSSRATLFASLAVGIRNSAANAWIGTAGVVSAPATLSLDTAFAKNDTIWIVASPALQILSTPPSPPAPLDTTWLFVFNPWDGVFPLARPVAYLDGAAAGTPMEASATHCGWYQLPVFSAKQVLFRNSRTGTSFGNGGAGSNTPIALAASQDSHWIAANGTSVAISRSAPAQRGVCTRALLASTVYDFELQAPGFGELLTGVLRGIVADTLDADRKPVLATDTGRASGLAIWFRDTPGQNASTCRDLVLELDTATGIYRMDDPEFFPVDDFTTVAGGGVNRYNNLVASASLPHNYSFCLESHGEFESKPGQTLEFTGDDDFWYFIDGRLRMDLGGVHGPASGAVSLDTMALPAGRTIPWDFFFCERMPSGSSLKITTSMNLRTSASYSIADSTAPGKRILRLWASTTQGQGCAAKVVRKSARGQVFLSGGTLASPSLLATGTHFGGIQVLDSSWQVSLDTSRLKGLAPGAYVLRIRSFDDTTRFRDIAFSIPVPPPPPPPPPPPEHPLVPGTRCDLLSGPVVDTTRCIDIGSLDGTTLRVPAATTRISSKGLVLCGAKESKPEGTDIVYIIDQSGSMWNKYILPLDTDTIGFYECNGAAFSSTTIAVFRGNNVTVIPRSDSALAMQQCNVSGDIYEQRGLVVQEAIRLHSEISPGSQAAWISFGGEFDPSELVELSDSAATARLIADVKAARLGGTNYEEPLAWARLLLQGGVRDGDDSVRSGSRNRRKAIIMISDGEPSDAPDYLDALTKDAWAYSSDGTEDWTVAGDSAPPIYGFFLSNLVRSGGALRTLADRTRGEFHQIPPSRPDSLRKVMTRVLGNIVAAKRPDSLRIVNTTNGQISVGITSGAEGGGFRMTLDSLVGLVPGSNVLELRSVLTGQRDSIVTARWTVVVSDSGSQFTLAGTDSTLMAACTAPSRISLKPASDTTRAFANELDSVLKLSLDVAYDGQLRFPVGFASALSLDSGTRSLSIAKAPSIPRAKSSGELPWKLLAGSADRKDGIVQTGFGWDTVTATFHTPRDPRDTATAKLAVRHSWPVGVMLSPDTAQGVSGSFSVFVHDTNTVSDFVVATISHRLGDRLQVVLRRIGPSDFAGTFPFRQSAAVVGSDSILQTGPARVLAFDSVVATYGTATDIALLRRPDPSLKFVGADGSAFDAIAPIVLDIGETAPLRIATFLAGSVIDQKDSASISLPDWLEALDSTGSRRLDGIRLVGGVASILVRGKAPGTAGAIRFDVSGRPDSLVGSPVSVLPYRIRFVGADGLAIDSLGIDRDVRSRETVRFQIWGRGGICATCTGTATIQSASNAIRIQDPTGTVVGSVPVVGGEGVFAVEGIAPISNASVSIDAPSLFAAGSVSPVTFRAYRIRYRLPGGGISDSLSIDEDFTTPTTVRAEIWGRDGICTACTGSLAISSPDTAIVLADTAGFPSTAIRIVGGVATFVAKGRAPAASASVALAFDSLFASNAIRPISLRPFRLVFLDSLGSPSDSRDIDRQVRSTEIVRALLVGKNGVCGDCSGTLRIAGSATGLSVTDSVDPGAAPRIRSGTAVLRIRSDVPLDAESIVLSFDSLFASATIAPVRFTAPPPDSVVYEDRDGDGALDHARLFFRIPWNPTNTFVLPWPEAGSFLDLSAAALAPDADSTILDISLATPQSPRRTAWTAGAVPASWNWSPSRPLANFPAIERIAPIPVRARILRGKGHDTLLVKASEAIQPERVVAGADLLRRVAPGLPALTSANVSWNAADLSLRLVFPSDSIDALVRPADSIRFAANAAARDIGGVAPGDTAPAVVVEGIDRAPTSAIVSDADADGRADHVVLRFATAPRVVDLYRFRWPDTSGALVERAAKPSGAASDSAGRILTFSVAPFAFGATSCAVPGCADLGTMETYRFGDTIRAIHDEIDGVAPVILKAQLRFGKPLGTLDTVRAWLSESVDAASGAEWLRWGRPGRDSLGDSILDLGARHPSGRLLEFLVDSNFLATDKDSLRIGSWPSGGTQDLAGNRPGRFAHWTPLELGPIPIRLDAKPWPSMARNTGWTAPSGEPPLSVYVRATGKDEWRSLDGRRSPTEPSHYVGVLLQANSDIDDGTLYLYDNLGVAVAKLELAELAQAVRQSRTQRTLRGGYQVWIAWNGTTSRGEFAPTGVYIGRLVVWKRVDGQQSLVHQVFKLGWQMPTVHNWDENDMPNW